MARFFRTVSDKQFEITAYRALEALIARRDSFPGSPGGWLGGLLYAVTRWLLLGRPIVLNADMEQIVGASMSTIRKRSEQVWQLIERDAYHLVPTPGWLTQQRNLF